MSSSTSRTASMSPNSVENSTSEVSPGATRVESGAAVAWLQKAADERASIQGTPPTRSTSIPTNLSPDSEGQRNPGNGFGRSGGRGRGGYRSPLGSNENLRNLANPRPRGGPSAPTNWFYKDWSGEHGPRTLVQLTHALQKGYLTPELLVRKEGNQRWHTLRDVLDLRQALKARRMRVGGGGAGGYAGPQRLRPQSSPEQQQQQSPPKVGALTPDVEESISRLFLTPADWFYSDSQGVLQGPFPSPRMAKWWSSPQYRGHFATLKCRRGTTGDFRLLSLIAAESNSGSHDSPSIPMVTISVEEKGTVAIKPYTTDPAASSSPAADASIAAAELEELRRRVDELEEENERLRNGEDDSFILRMQVEKLHKEKTELAKETSQLKRENQNLQELLSYAQQYDVGVDEAGGLFLGDDLLGSEGEGEDEGEEGVVEEEDAATKEWLEELRRAAEAAPQ